VGLFREATAHPDASQNVSCYCKVATGKNITRAASSLNLAISGLLPTTNLEGKQEYALAFRDYFVSSHLFQMQRIYLGFFFGPWGGKESLS